MKPQHHKLHSPLWLDSIASAARHRAHRQRRLTMRLTVVLAIVVALGALKLWLER